jgi:hypothetical protein
MDQAGFCPAWNQRQNADLFYIPREMVKLWVTLEYRFWGSTLNLADIPYRAKCKRCTVQYSFFYVAFSVFFFPYNYTTLFSILPFSVFVFFLKYTTLFSVLAFSAFFSF